MGDDPRRTIPPIFCSPCALPQVVLLFASLLKSFAVRNGLSRRHQGGGQTFPRLFSFSAVSRVAFGNSPDPRMRSSLLTLVAIAAQFPVWWASVDARSHDVEK